jgi:hypothetical protein
VSDGVGGVSDNFEKLVQQMQHLSLAQLCSRKVSQLLEVASS